MSAATIVVVLASGGAVMAARGGSDAGSIRTRNAAAGSTSAPSSSAAETTFTSPSTGPGPADSSTSIPLGQGGELLATPTSGLANLDDVTIDGTGLQPGSYDVGQCPATSVASNTLTDCLLNDVVNVTDGNLLAHVRAFWWMRSGQIDCGAAPGTCVVGLRSTDPSSKFVSTTFPLAFDPAKKPVITVTPATGLVNGQQVEVHGVNVGAGSVSFGECLRDTYGSCQYADATAGADGTFTATFAVQRVLHWGFHGMTDQTSVCNIDGDCVIEVWITPNGFENFDSTVYRVWINPTQPIVLAFASPPPATTTTTNVPSTASPNTPTTTG